MATHLRTELVVDALEMALRRRNPDVGLIHHMDRGVQFAALSFGKRLEEAGIVASMSRVGSALDNVFLARLRGEFRGEILLLYEGHRFISRGTARTAVFDSIEGSHNRV